MVHCFHLAGFPKGLISCITGKGSEIGDFLTMHPGVNCIRYSLSMSNDQLLFLYYIRLLFLGSHSFELNSFSASLVETLVLQSQRRRA